VSPARAPRSDPRLLALDPRTGALRDTHVTALDALVRPGDLLVFNDAATVPASLRAQTPSVPFVFEVRLAGAPHLEDESLLDAVLFGPGDWRTPTEYRAPAPALSPGLSLHFVRDGVALPLGATVHSIDPRSPRLVTLRFDRTHAELYRAVYALGVPVQYSYLSRPLAVWDVQTRYGARPWAVEAPSAGLPLRFRTLDALRARGVRLACVTHAAGLSSTGDDTLDARLPLPERYEVSRETARAITATKESYGRVIAVGTSAARALEGAVRDAGGLAQLSLDGRAGVTDLLLGPHTELRVVDGLFTGLHEPTASHYSLLQAFAPRSALTRAYEHAESRGYLGHEFGDTNLILAA